MYARTQHYRVRVCAYQVNVRVRVRVHARRWSDFLTYARAARAHVVVWCVCVTGGGVVARQVDVHDQQNTLLPFAAVLAGRVLRVGVINIMMYKPKLRIEMCTFIFVTPQCVTRYAEPPQPQPATASDGLSVPAENCRRQQRRKYDKIKI